MMIPCSVHKREVKFPEAFESFGMSCRQHPVKTSNVSLCGQFLGRMERPTDIVGNTSGLVLPPKHFFCWSSTSSPSCSTRVLTTSGVDTLHCFRWKARSKARNNGISVYNERAQKVWVLENGGVHHL